MDRFRCILKENGVQVTRQRLEVYQILKELNTHVTADDIRKVLADRGNSMTVATVYNILNLFEEKGLVIRVGTAGEPVIYDINTYDHIHVCDSDTRHVRDYADHGLLDAVNHYLKKNPPKDLDLQRIDISLIGHDKIPSSGEPEKK